MLLCLTITHWLWILLLKVWLLLDGGFKWIVLRSDKELIARNKSPEQWRKATHGVARRYRLLRWGNGVLDCQDGLEFYFILFCWLLTMMRDSGTAGRGQSMRAILDLINIWCVYNSMRMKAFVCGHAKCMFQQARIQHVQLRLCIQAIFQMFARFGGKLLCLPFSLCCVCLWIHTGFDLYRSHAPKPQNLM